MADDWVQPLRSATDAGNGLWLAVSGQSPDASTRLDLEQPFAIVGRGDGCNVLLRDPSVSFRHAYLQVIEGRVFAVDLASRSGVHWPDGPRKSGWVPPGVSIRVGPFALEIIGDQDRDRSLAGSHGDLSPLDRYRDQAGPRPRVDLEFLYESASQPTWSVNRLLTLIGRSSVCKLRLDHPDVSAVHCSLLLTRDGLWVIDLMGRGGTKIDNQKVCAALLRGGHEIEIADNRIRVLQEEIGAPTNAAGSGHKASQSADELQSPFLRDPVEDGATKAAGTDWLGTIFAVDARDDTLIVVPVAEGSGFRYQQLHVEANALQRMFDTKQFKNIVVDLAKLNYFGSELIGVLVRLARAVSNNQGQAAFCSASPRMLEVLQSMRLNKLWPIYSTRAEAMQRVRQN